MGQSASKPTPGAKLISTSVNGDYKVCKWLVPEKNDDQTNEFSVRYKVNLSKLISTYDENEKELQGLRAFMDGIANDKNKQIKRIEVTGYASPDGTHALNEKLSKARAVDCSTYIKEHHDIPNCPCSANGIAMEWSDAVTAINSSSIPQKAEVLQVINGGGSQMEIESKLRAMNPSWDYMRTTLLPPMRRVEIEVVYSSWIEMVTRTPIEPEMVEEVVVANNYYLFFEDNPSEFMIFENSNAPLDFDDAKCKMKFKDDRHRDKFKDVDHSLFGRDKTKGKMKKDRYPRRR